jgi:hypothetical protein
VHATADSRLDMATIERLTGVKGDLNADGDFVMFEPEVQPVLKAVRGAGIDIVAIHHHMIEESPRTVVLRYWGVGPTDELPKAALETQAR